jgi:tRNA C32,U32 (ribose-2'-O)-methylase TrmJ
MSTQKQTILLVEHLEKVLQRLAYENHQPHGSCCACLQDVETRGHLPSCIISQALARIKEWRG